MLEHQRPAATWSAPAGEEQLSLGWRRPSGMFGLSFVNLALRVITLGIYHFWAKTEVRQRIWSAIRINDEPLTYTGRGLELFLGFLIVMGVVFLPALLLVAALAFTFGPQHPVTNISSIALYVVFGFLFGVAIYRAQRYRLARTRWRGIRGALDGSSFRFAVTFFWTALLIPLTLGWIMPWRSTKLQSIIASNTRFGDRSLRFDAKAGPLYGPFAVAWVGGIATYLGLLGFLGAIMYEKILASQQTGLPPIPSARDAGLSIAAILVAGVIFALVSAWYRARTINHFANHTHFENASFSGRLTAVGLIWLSITNFLIMLSGALLLGLILTLCALPFFDFANPAAIVQSRTGLFVLQLIPLAILVGFALFGPIIQARSAGYVVRNLSLDGTAPIDEIAQAAGADVRFGEGLAEAFDVDAI